jgi:hypothetical protein
MSTLNVKFVRWCPLSTLLPGGNISEATLDQDTSFVTTLSSRDTICNINDTAGQETTIGRKEFVSASILACPRRCGDPAVDSVGSTDIDQFFKTLLASKGTLCESCRIMLDIGMRGCSKKMVRISTAGTQADPVVHLYGKGLNLDSYVSVDGHHVFSSIGAGEDGWKGPVVWGLRGRLRIEVGFRWSRRFPSLDS